MKNIYLHDKKNIRTINLILFILSIPLILFGFYKNGIVVLLKDKIGIIEMFIPLILPFVFYYIVYFLTYYKNKKKFKKSVLEYSLLPNYGLLIGMCIPPHNNLIITILIFIIISFIYIYFLDNKVSINYMALSLLIIIIVNMLVLKVNYLELYSNQYELSTELQYSTFSNIMGFNFGGLSSSSNILILFFAIILCATSIYKYEISITTTIVYIIIFFILKILGVSISYHDIFNFSSLFLILIIGTEMKTTPVTIAGRNTYGILLGIFIFIFSFLGMPISILLSIIICSIISPILNIIYRKN